jgi:hypothetical protein
MVAAGDVLARGDAQRRGDHYRVAQRACQPGLLAVGEHVAADVHADQQVATQLRNRGRDSSRGPRGSAADVHQHRLGAQVGRHARLAERDSLRSAGLGPGQHRRAAELPAAPDLAQRPRSRMRIDWDPLPGDPAQHERRSQRFAQPGNRQSPDYVTAAADPEDQRALGRADDCDQLVRARDGVTGHGRLPPNRSRRSL